MAQQQDPNSDPNRGSAGQKGIVAGSQDTYRAKGFTSPNVTPPSNTLSSVNEAPKPAATDPVTWGKYSGASTPGILAAMNSGGSGQPGQPNMPGIGSGAILQNLGIGGRLLSSALGQNNNSQLQDIGGALYQGRPITDADWARAGYTPGGAALLPTQPLTGLRSITMAPALFGAGGATAMQALQRQQQPAGTMPANAIIRPM